MTDRCTPIWTAKRPQVDTPSSWGGRGAAAGAARCWWGRRQHSLARGHGFTALYRYHPAAIGRTGFSQPILKLMATQKPAHESTAACFRHHPRLQAIEKPLAGEGPRERGTSGQRRTAQGKRTSARVARRRPRIPASASRAPAAGGEPGARGAARRGARTRTSPAATALETRLENAQEPRQRSAGGGMRVLGIKRVRVPRLAPWEPALASPRGPDPLRGGGVGILV